MDVSDAVTAIGLAVVGIGLVGGAKMIPAATVKAWGFISSAIRGG